MNPASGALDRARVLAPPAAPVLRPGPLLAGALTAAAAGCGLLTWSLRAFLARYDTLAYLLQEGHSVEMTRIRFLLLIAGLALAAAGSVALISWRTALGLVGGGLLLAGVLARSLVRVYLAPGVGLEESLIYRLRGFSAVGVLGGLFLLFLSLIPVLLDRPVCSLERILADRARRGVERLRAASSLRRRVAVGMLAFFLATAVALLVLQNFPNSSDESSYLTQARIFASGRLWVDAPPRPEFFRARSFVMDEGRGRFFAKAFPGWAALLSLGVMSGVPWAVNPFLSAVTLILAGWAGGSLLKRDGELAV